MFVVSAAVGNSGRASNDTESLVPLTWLYLDKTEMLTVWLGYPNLKLIVIISNKGRYQTSPPSHGEFLNVFTCA